MEILLILCAIAAILYLFRAYLFFAILWLFSMYIKIAIKFSKKGGLD